MSEFKNTELYKEIYHQIKILWNNYDKDGDDMEDIIDEFRYEYLHISSEFWFSSYFITEFKADTVLKSQKFIIEMYNNDVDNDHHNEDDDYESGLKKIMEDILTIEKLQAHILYWIMNDFCNKLMENDEK